VQGEIRLEELTKRFDEVVAVDGIDLRMPPGEFFTMLGPSGCGKTTTLRMIAGFERPTSGRIMLDGTDVADVPPHRRSVNTVFQSYALFPHLDVAGNVAFGLKYKRLTKDERRIAVREVLDVVQLGGLEHRKPSQLSGGQQQRVALARALVLKPRVLLLDEPLGALDARLRKGLQVELKALQRELGVTFVFVTHDQEEALTMSDRIAVMNGGHVEQAGDPRSIYESPETEFVAEFLGVSNLVEAQATPAGDAAEIAIGDQRLTARVGETSARGTVKVMIRPERVGVEAQGAEGPNRLPGMVEHSIFVGAATELHVRIPGGALLKAQLPNDGTRDELAQGAPVVLHVPADALRVLRPAAAEASGENASEEPAGAAVS
jgi:spermidine/putrescine transport system ATP-binding protein